MRNLTKKFITFVFSVLFVLNLSMTAFATEVHPPSNEEIGDCRLTFSVVDETNGICVDEIGITLLNLETTVEYKYTVSSVDYLFGLTVGGNVKQGKYNIALNFPSKGTFIVQNADGTAISNFTADSTEHTFNWIIVSDNENQQGGTASDTAGSALSDFGQETGNEEADALWRTFLETVAPIETDIKYASILKLVSDTAVFNSTYYENATGNSKDEYLEMTNFEQFLWYSTYILPINAITSSDYDTYCGSVAKWNSNAVGIPYNWFNTYATSEMADAYRALMEWDYYYFTSNGAVYNFITGKSSIENNDLEVLSPDDANGNDGEPTQEEIDDLIKEEIESTDTDTDKGIWSDTKKLIKDNVVTLVILLILVGATIGVIIYRKRKTIDDDKVS